MPEEIKYYLGIIAGIISLLSYVVYIVAIYKGSTKPNTFTWIVLTVNGSLIALTYHYSGAFNTIWVALSYAVGPGLIALFAIKKGENKWGIMETISTGGIILGLLVWFFTNSSFIGLLVNISVDFLGILPTLEKSFYRPWTEDKTAWILVLIAMIINVIAIESWTVEIYLYPIYLLIVDGIIAVLLLTRKNQSTRLSS